MSEPRLPLDAAIGARFHIIDQGSVTELLEEAYMVRRESPWAVRGISQQARGAALDAAKKAGQPLGAWLTEAILATAKRQEQGEPVATDGAASVAEPTEIVTTVGRVNVRVIVSTT